MPGDSYDRLTERQLEVLRLLPRFNDHELVARELKITRHAVRERLRLARNVLNAKTSWEAALIVQAREAESTRLQTPSSPPERFEDDRTREESAGENAYPIELREDVFSNGSNDDFDSLRSPRRWRDLFVRSNPTAQNNLSILESLIAIGIVLAGIAVALLLVMASMEAFSRERIALKPTEAGQLTAAQIVDRATAIARCRDNTYSWSRVHQGSCSHHGGVAQWLDPPGRP